jgi:MEMO1 family protein
MSEAQIPDPPRLRPVEVFPVHSDGDGMVCLRDTQGIAEHPIVLNRFLMFVVSRMDGGNTLRDIQAHFMRATGEIVPLETLQQIVRQLDEQYYLDSARFRHRCQAMADGFRGAPVRPARHAGSAYAAEGPQLTAQLSSLFEAARLPGKQPVTDSARPLRGLVAPHIDFHRGGAAYAYAYRALSEHPEADRYIIFGTAHCAMQERFALTAKSFDTPLGEVRTDRAFVEAIAAAAAKDYFADEFAHRGEHSIEFQTVCLKHVLGDRTDFQIVPILVGSFRDLHTDGKTPAQDAEIQSMVSAVRRAMDQSGRRCCVIAGADLAHVGRRFGDSSGPTSSSLREVEMEDRRFLALVEAGEAEAVFQAIAAENDKRNVCGYPPIYMTLRCLGDARGQLLQYRQWSDLQEGAAVTFASVALF